MGIASTVAKVGMGALGGGPIGGAVTAVALASELWPLITDFTSGGEEQAPEKIAKIKEARDGMAQRLMAASGMSLEKATAAVNEQLKPMIDQASAPTEGVSAGKKLGDLAATGITAAMALRGKAMTGAARAKNATMRRASMDRRASPDGASPAGPAAGAAAAPAPSPTPSPMGNSGGMGTGSARPAPPPSPMGNSSSMVPPEPPMSREAIAVPPDGGTMPDPELAALRDLMIAARMKGRRPPAAYEEPPLGLPMSPETGRRLDEGRMRSRLYAGEGD